MSNPYSIEAMHDMRTRVWATRDGCMDHYPRHCPPDCPNAGKHDAGLADEYGACECHQCRTT